MTTDSPSAPPLDGMDLILLSTDFLVGHSVVVYLRQMGARVDGPFDTSRDLMKRLTRAQFPTAVIAQLDHGHSGFPDMRETLRNTGVPLVIVDPATRWERMLFDTLVALKTTG